MHPFLQLYKSSLLHPSAFHILFAIYVPQNLTVVTRIIQLAGTLDFGDVFLGEDDQKIFTIASSGTGTIAVSNIVYPAGYTGSSKTSGSSLEVTVTFKPVNVIDYNGTITVESDKTSGINTIAVKGKGVKITALADQQLAKEFDVYPNPAKGVVYIKTKIQIPSVEMIDSQGRMSKEVVTKFDANASQIDITRYAAGNYFLKIPTATGHVIKQVVIQD